MLKNILVGLDGTEYSHAAIELGIQWCRRIPAQLVGLGIVDEPAIMAPEASPMAPGTLKEERDAARLHDARRQVEGMLEQFSLRCAEAGVTSKVLEEVGSPTEQIIEESQRYDLILLGRETYFKFETQEGPDSTLTQVLCQCPRPVVTVPANPVSGKNILIAYDGSLQSARAMQMLVHLHPPVDGEYHLLTLHKDHMLAGKIADRGADYLRSHSITPHIHAVSPHSSIPDSLLEFVKETEAGLLVMGAFGQSSLAEFFFGSTTKTVLQKTTIPLFLSN